MAKQKVVIHLKRIILVRLRCDEDHKDPWLKRLYVLWADPKDISAQGKSPNFHLAQTDTSGYLSPILSDLDPHPTETKKLFPDYEYYFYFVRHPETKLPQQILTELNDDLEAAKKKWGDWQAMKPQLETTGKDKKGRAIKEAIVRISEDASSFIPAGSDLYKGWVLFRDMPGGSEAHKSIRVDQCPPLLQQVTRLQFHLGALRYPIGNHRHPYMPAPWKKLPEEDGLLYPNEGVFDTLTWSCVLKFQRDVRGGIVGVLDPAKSRTPILSPGSYEPTSGARDAHLMIRESPNYVSEQSTSYNDARADEASGASDEASDVSDAQADLPFDTVVDKETGDAIQRWLDRGWRKPGKVLVAKKELDSWMMEDVLPAINELSAELIRLGFGPGAQFNSTFRDARMSVGVAQGGQIVRSIHKSGYAFDMAMTAYTDPRKSCPLYYSKDKGVTDKTMWTVYALVADSKIPNGVPASYVEYVKKINYWKYDKTSPDGGREIPLTADDAAHDLGRREFSAPCSFLNFTKVANHFGFIRISAHSSGWQELPYKEFCLETPEQFRALVNRLSLQLKQGPNTTLVINSSPVQMSDFKSAVEYLRKWLDATTGYNPTPDVIVEPWTKQGHKLLKELMTKPFRGQKVLETEEGQTAGSEIELSSKYNFKGGLYSFKLRPITAPITLKPGDEVDVPKAFGDPAHMEWWHFQYPGGSKPGVGYSDKTWGNILGDVGWTDEGLLDAKANKWIYGHWGLGYTSKDLAAEAR